MLWISVNMGNEYTVTKRIPVVIENLKEGKALRFPVPKQMAVSVHGRGWLLAGLWFLPEIKYFIDVSSLNTQVLTITDDDLQEHVTFPVTVQVVDVQPETLLVALDEYREKRVPVIPHVLLDYHEGYGQVGAIQIEPESILIGGAKNAIDGISAWQTEYQKITNISSSIDEEIPVDEPASYAIEVFRNDVRLRVNVQPFAEKIFVGIPVEAQSVPPNREIIFIPPKMDVTVRAGIDQLSALSNESFHANADYQTLSQDTAGIAEPVLSYPEGIKIVGKKPERFQFFIRKKL